MAYKRELIAQTKNLFNLATASVGYIQWEGNLNHSEDTVTYPLSSDYLECTPNTSYTISAFCGKHPVTNDLTLWCRIAYYDENKQILTRSQNSSTNTNIDYISVTASAPTNAKYLRATTRWMSPTYREQHPENWVMLEKNSTATDYVPYGHLSSYKKLLKVSDVCQLLDKSKYSATTTKNGVTYTNNEDGTVTLNGTATAWAPFLASAKFDVFLGHKYLLYPNPTDVNVSLQLGFRNAAGVWLAQWLCNSPTVFTLTDKNAATGQFWVGVGEGKTVSNAIVTPQAFDLTEMYGAGNEPKTVAEFKAKFPNELYDYSPRCWVKSYKTGLIAETKNLFQYPTELVSGRDYSNSMLVEKLPNGVVLQGNPGAQPGASNYSSGWFTPRQYAIDLDAEDVVTISADYYMIEAATTYNGTIAIGLYLADGSSGDLILVDFDKGEQYKRLSVKKVVPKAKNYYPVFSLNSSKVKITNIQIEKGTTVTDYVPYGYL